MADVFTASAPGEVIFFGEHSVVYGKRAIACSIGSGIRIDFVPRSSGLKIVSGLGEGTADLKDGSILEVSAAEEIRPLFELIKGVIRNHNAAALPCEMRIESDIPEQSGLASSAAVASALVTGWDYLLNLNMQDTAKVDAVFEGEIHIQKRGSILGSACTMLGGLVEVQDGKWSKKDFFSDDLPEIVIIDSADRCPTSHSTAKVKSLMDSDPRMVEIYFEEMDRIAADGIEAICSGKWEQVGSLMNENQKYLMKLGVSTGRIDRILADCSSFAYGGKITGAGGGGCCFLLPKEGCEKPIAEAVQKHGGRILQTQLASEGAIISTGITA